MADPIQLRALFLWLLFLPCFIPIALYRAVFQKYEISSISNSLRAPITFDLCSVGVLHNSWVGMFSASSLNVPWSDQQVTSLTDSSFSCHNLLFTTFLITQEKRSYFHFFYLT